MMEGTALQPSTAKRSAKLGDKDTALRRAERLDARLVKLARGASRARLFLGDMLEAFARKSGHHAFGYSSFQAYAVEQSGRRSRWVTETRTVARRLRLLPELRSALVSGAIGWSKAELAARGGIEGSDSELAVLASSLTVRQMRHHLASGAGTERSTGVPPPTPPAATEAAPGDGATSLGNGIAEPQSTVETALEEATDTVSLHLKLSPTDTWMFFWLGRFASHVSGVYQTHEETLSAALAETFTSLCSQLPSDALLRAAGADAASAEREAAARAKQELLARLRDESEQRAEPRFRATQTQSADYEALSSSYDDVDSWTLEQLHAQIRQAAKELSTRDIELGRVALSFHRERSAKALGFATEQQYAREQLGMSGSQFKARVTLATRLSHPVRVALAQGRIGHEAASLIVRIADEKTTEAWLERASLRTVKHLREEVQIAELLRATTGDTGAPPTERTVRDVRDLEGRLLAGDRSVLDMPAGRMSALRGGRVALRLRVSRDTARFYRALEELLCRSGRLSESHSFIRHLCDTFWDAWGHYETRQHGQFGRVYQRDCFRCQSPVCERRDVGPHHLRFRSHGGTDDDENVVSLCAWCHLDGVHRGRLTVTGPASNPTWLVGPALRLMGRRVVRRA